MFSAYVPGLQVWGAERHLLKGISPSLVIISSSHGSLNVQQGLKLSL